MSYEKNPVAIATALSTQKHAQQLLLAHMRDYPERVIFLLPAYYLLFPLPPPPQPSRYFVGTTTEDMQAVNTHTNVMLTIPRRVHVPKGCPLVFY